MSHNAMLTVADAAQHARVKAEIILDHIHGGRIKAVNVGRGHRRPRWRIRFEDFEAFLQSRTARPPAKRQRRPGKTQEAVTQYF